MRDSEIDDTAFLSLDADERDTLPCLHIAGCCDEPRRIVAMTFGTGRSMIKCRQGKRKDDLVQPRATRPWGPRAVSGSASASRRDSSETTVGILASCVSTRQMVRFHVRVDSNERAHSMRQPVAVTRSCVLPSCIDQIPRSRPPEKARGVGSRRRRASALPPPRGR